MNIPRTLWNLYGLKRNESLFPAKLQSIQQKKLRRLLHYAWDHSPYYRETFERAGITEEKLDTAPLSAFPAIDKAALLKNFDRLVTVPDLKQAELRRFDAVETTDRRPLLGKYHLVHSSGSTGEPGYFVYDKAAWNTMLLGIIRGTLWGMSMPQILRLLAGKPRILYIAATDGRYGGAMAVGDGVEGVGASQMYLDIKTPLSQWVEQVKLFGPNFIIGYPSAIKILAELAQRGEVSLSVLRVVSCGEPLGASLRKFLEDTLHAEVINFYGASESLAIEGFCIPGLLDYQFRQTGKDCFEILAETTPSAEQRAIEGELRQQLGGILLEKGLSYLTFSLRFVEEIRPDLATGKKRLVLPLSQRERRNAG